MNDTFDQMFPRRPAMTADEARNVVAEMMRDTHPDARNHLLRIAIKVGNLTDEAKAVYLAALT